MASYHFTMESRTLFSSVINHDGFGSKVDIMLVKRNLAVDYYISSFHSDMSKFIVNRFHAFVKDDVIAKINSNFCFLLSFLNHCKRGLCFFNILVFFTLVIFYSC